MNNTTRATILAAACMLSLAMSAQPATVRVYGTVTDSEGTVVPGVAISFRADGDTVTTVSDIDGRYEVLLTAHPDGINEESSPAPFALSQNYPNPFNPETTIPFSLDRSARVRLDIYSATGQHIRTLTDDVYGAGTHSAVWDGRDDSGRGVSAGVYLYRLKAGSQVAAKKMLLLDGGGAGGVMAPSPAKAAVAMTEREYYVEAHKGTLFTLFTAGVSFATAETEVNIEFTRPYQKHVLFLDSIRLFNEFALPGDILTVVLAEKDDVLPESRTVTLTSRAGDVETVVVGDNGFYLRNYANCGYFYADDSRKSSIVTVAAPPAPGDGILQIDAVSDTVSAWYVTALGDTLSAYMPVVAAYRTVTMWDITYTSWRAGEWYAGENDRYGDLTVPDDFSVKFSETASESDIESFIDDNGLEIRMIYDFIDRYYRFTIPTGIHSVELLEQYNGSDIIEHAQPDILICVGPA